MPKTKTPEKLGFPEGNGLRPHLEPPSVDMILEASEEFLAVWNRLPAWEQERLRRKCRVPFVLSPEAASGGRQQCEPNPHDAG